MEEWDQQRADSRSIETMRRIAQDAMCFGDDDAAFYTYADQHKLTVNEIVYYLNAYEAGGDKGLHALRAPDIIPPEVARRARKTIAAMLEEWSPDLPYRTTDEGAAIGLYEIQQRQSGEKYLFEICQLRWTACQQPLASLLDALVRRLVAILASQARPQAYAQSPDAAGD